MRDMYLFENKIRVIAYIFNGFSVSAFPVCQCIISSFVLATYQLPAFA